MPNCLSLIAPAVAAGLFSTVITLNPNWALAAGDCIEQPSREPAAGGHWYYRTDRLNNRKCWYLTEPEAAMPQAEAPKAAAPNETTSKGENTRQTARDTAVSSARFLNQAEPNAFEE